MAATPNVWTVPAGAPFLDTLVEALLDGRLIEGFAADDPFALADTTLYLPTRRAARAIRERFLIRLGRPLLLPRIRTLGDLDEDGDPVESDAPDLPPAVSTTERQLVLTRLVLGWSGALVRSAAELPDEELLVPASPADAARLASALGRLIDQVGADPAAWSGLFSGIPADLARFWEITLEFLKIATTFWPAHLAERGLLDPGARRDALIRAEAERLATAGSPSPVIAAGSTGSVPATAALLAAIARQPNGAVVLPGLDQNLDAESWAEIGPSEREPAGAGHPQYGLKLLLQSFGLRREEVQPLGLAPPELAQRAWLVSEAMRPAGTTDRWSDRASTSAAEHTAALEHAGVVEAANEREEALAVAVILRGAAETPGKVAALVTPDRGLARRVAVELRRWDIDVDDSAGRPLNSTPPGVLARLVAEAGLHGAEPETILALAKHPLATFGLPPSEARRAARALERAVLRGPRLKPGLGPMRHAFDVLMNERFVRREGFGTTYPSEASRRLSESDWRAARDLLVRLEAALRPLEELAEMPAAPLSALVEAHFAALTEATRDEAGSSPGFAANEAVEALARSFEELRESGGSGPDVSPSDYPDLFTALVEGVAVRRRGGLDPRIHIWGTLEARLQAVDTIVLGGLNEGSWPGRTRLDPLLSRPMRAALALDPPERRIGLSAHDFAQGLGHKAVWLTRANRQDGEPRVASRWLQRLVAYAGDDLALALRAKGAGILHLARSLDAADRISPAERPRPSPPLDLRPKKLRVTEIEALIRDPYAIYARHVLGLSPFEAIGALPDASERGSLIHRILERFIGERRRGPFDDAAEARLLEIGREEFAKWSDFPEIGTLWWPRFERIARWFVAEERKRADVVERLVENKGSWAVTPEFELSVRADRLDRLSNGKLAIVDYKTGRPPGGEEVLSLAPQLPLEALIAQKGGFHGIAAATVDRLEYFHISGRAEGGAICERGTREKPKNGKPALTLPEALAATDRRLRDLIAYFAEPEAEYLSRKIPRRGRDFAGDYDHLARVAEWSVAEADDETAGDEP